MDGICARYHRHIHAGVRAAVLTKPLPDGAMAAGNPLWLALAVEELNLLDADDFARVESDFQGTPEARLHQLMLAVVDEMPAGVEGLYGWMLGRAEALYGKPLARAPSSISLH